MITHVHNRVVVKYIAVCVIAVILSVIISILVGYIIWKFRLEGEERTED